MPEHARIASFKLVYFRFICFGVCLGGGWFVMLDLEACSTKFGKWASRERKFKFLFFIYPWILDIFSLDFYLEALKVWFHGIDPDLKHIEVRVWSGFGTLESPFFWTRWIFFLHQLSDYSFFATRTEWNFYDYIQYDCLFFQAETWLELEHLYGL